MVWDYNVGLVRMTPLFKSLKYSKVCCCPSLTTLLLTTTDCAGEGLEGEPGPERHQL